MNRPTLVSISILLALVSACTDSRRPASPDAASDTAQTRPDTLDAGDPDANPPPSDTVSADDDASESDQQGSDDGVAAPMTCEALACGPGQRCASMPDGPRCLDATGACVGVDCTGHGHCIERDGEATCECEAGYEPQGLACVSQCPRWAPGEQPLDITTVDLDAQITINGSEPQTTLTLRLESVDDAGRVNLLVRSDGTVLNLFGDTIEVAPGTYQVFYTWRSLGDSTTAPLTPLADLGRIDIAQDTTLALDIEVVDVDLVATVDGAAPPLMWMSFANADPTLPLELPLIVSLSVDEQGDLTRRSLRLIPGRYAFDYGAPFPVEGSLPRNEDAALGNRDVTTSSPELAFELHTVELGTSLTIDGRTPAGPSQLIFTASDGDRFTLDLSADGHLDTPDGTVRVLPGTYDVFYAASTPGGSALDPANRHLHLGSFAINTDVQLGLDVPSVELTTTLTVDGAPAGEDAGLTFVAADGEVQFVARMLDGSTSMVVAPATYDVFYWHDASAPATSVSPRNTWRHLGAHTIATDGELNLVVDTARLDAALTFDGIEPSSPVWVALVADDGDGLYLQLPTDAPVPVAPASYDVYLRSRHGDSELSGLDDVAGQPWNDWQFVGRHTVAGDTVLELDVSTIELGARLTIDGREPGRAAWLRFESSDGLSHFRVQVQADGTLDTGDAGAVLSAPGTYHVFYHHASGSDRDTTPRNEGLRLGCWTLAP